MAEMLNVRVESTLGGSSRVTPIFDEVNIDVREGSLSLEVQDSRGTAADGEEFSGERNPQDGWLPITESRKGNSLSAAFHLLCSGIGIQALLLPIGFVSLGWFWGILWLSVAFSWQLYTIWLLVDLHESSSPTGIRYSRFLHLSIVAFGEKLGKLLAMFPTMYLSGGTCVLYIITGGSTIQLFYQTIFEPNSKPLTGAECFLVFILLAIVIAQFFANLNSLAPISLIGSITALAYCSLLWVLSVSKGRPHDLAGESRLNGGDDDGGIRNVLNGIGIIALAFRGHNLALEIQGTMPTNRKQPSRKPMLRGVTISYLLIAMCLYPLAIVGHWAYGNKIPPSRGILSAFTKFHQDNTSKYIIGAIYLVIIINYLCAFQIYAMPTLDNFERIYISKKHEPCPRWVRAAIKVFFGGLTYFVAVAFPFLPSLGAFIGSIGLPLTLAYPCLMWVAMKKPRRFCRMWCLNLGLGYSGIVLSLVLAGAALWSLIVDGLDANFFHP